MNLVLDAHALLWFIWDDQRLSATAKSLIKDAANRKNVSLATCWEIAIKAGIGKLKLGSLAAVFLQREITRNNFDLLSITPGTCYGSGNPATPSLMHTA